MKKRQPTIHYPLHAKCRPTHCFSARCLTGRFGNAMLARTPTHESMMVAVFALTTVTDNSTFLPKWISHYSELVGAENLYIFDGGYGHAPADCKTDVNILRLPLRPSGPTHGYQKKSESISNFVGALLECYDYGVVTNVDEYLVLDPSAPDDFKSYIAKIKTSTVSALGLDVARNLKSEAPLTFDTSLLKQRHYAQISSSLTKPVIVKEPVTWSECMSKVRGKNFHVDPNLFLFRFKELDQDSAGIQAENSGENVADVSADRIALAESISDTQPVEGDERFKTARREQIYYRNILKWNQPGRIRGNKVVKIPRRFESSV